MGKNEEHFEIEVLAIFRRHFTNLAETAISTRASRDGNYLAITINVHAESQEQLDAAYQELSANPHVIMVL